MTAHDNPRGPSRRWPMLLGLLTLLALGESRADQWFMKIDGVPGELTEGQFAGWTSLQSAGSLVSVPMNPTNGTPGPASFSCEVRKATDRTSPLLVQRCAEGEPYGRVTLAYVLTQPPATQYRFTLDTVRVSSVTQDGSTRPEPREKEKIAFTFDKIEMACFDLDTRGRTIGGLTALFNQSTGQGRLKSRPPFRAIITRQDGPLGVLVTWPAESGHRYQIFGRATLGHPWANLIEVTASEDGPSSQFLPMDPPVLFLRVEEVE